MELDKQLLQIETPLLVLFVVAEMAFSAYYKTKTYETKDTLVNLAMTSANLLMDLVMRGLNLAMLYFFFQFAFFKIENVYIYWFALLLLEDLMYYFLHLVDHYSRFFWAMHVTHHSSEKFNLTVGFRSSVFQPLYRGLYFIPLVFIGFEPMHIFFMYALTQFWGTLVHNEHVKKLPTIIEYIFVTPSHHRVHHASNPIYLDKNMGMFFIIWDRIFGTFQEELPNEKPIYGLTTPLTTYNPIYVIFHEWIAILKDISKPITWKQRINYLFNLPGWSHDKSRMTSKQMREALRNKLS